MVPAISPWASGCHPRLPAAERHNSVKVPPFLGPVSDVITGELVVDGWEDVVWVVPGDSLQLIIKEHNKASTRPIYIVFLTIATPPLRYCCIDQR
jgi:hypothetical protein